MCQHTHCPTAPCPLTPLSPYALTITADAPMVHVAGQEHPISAREAKKKKLKVTGDAGRACVVGSTLLRAERDCACAPTTPLPLAYSPYALAITDNTPMVYVEGQENPVSARKAKKRKLKVTGDAGRACVVAGTLLRAEETVPTLCNVM